MMKAKPKKIGQQSKAITKRYEPTPEERAALNAFLAERSKIPRAKVEDIKGQAVLSLHHKNQAYGHALLMTGLATVDAEFAGEILVQLARASVQDERSISVPEKPALLCDFQADTTAVSGACHEGLESLPVSRCTRRCAEGQTKRDVSPRTFYESGDRRETSDSESAA